MDVRLRTAARWGWLPALLLVVGSAELAWLGTRGWLASVFLEGTGAILLTLRGRWPAVAVPLSTLTLGLIPLTGTRMDEPATPILFIVLGLFSLGRRLTLRPGVAALLLTLALLLAALFLPDPGSKDLTDVMFVLSLALPPFVLGTIVRRLHEQGRLLEAQQEVIAAQAVQAERDRIARELHDVIAHSISAMVVQTAAAQDLLRSHPDRAAELLASVAETGREALAETGRLLHLVRDDADELGLSPAPSVADLPTLVSSFCERGIDVQAQIELPADPLPSAVDVSTYRIAQEALTNAHRHGNGPVQLRITHGHDGLRLRCSNPVGPTSSQGAGLGSGLGSGLGLRGIGERARLLGGEVRSGLDDAGRFTLEVALPLPGQAP